MVRRFFRFCLVGLLVSLLVCTPALAASTTDGQLMMMSVDDDAGIMPLALYDDTFNINVKSRLYDAYSLSFIDADGGGSGSAAYKPGVNISNSPTYSTSQILHPDDTYGVIGFWLSSGSASDYLAYTGNTLSFRFVGLASQLNVGSLWFSTANLVFDHAEISFWGVHSGDITDTPFRRLNNVSESYLLGNTWRSYFMDGISVPGYSSMIHFQFYYKITNFNDIISYADENNDGKFRYCAYFGNGNYPNTAIYTSGGTAGVVTGGADTAAIDSVNQSVNQVNQTLQGMVSQLQGVSAGLAQMSQAITQMTSQLTQSLEQQTQSINAMLTAQIESIRRDLGLLDDTVSSGLNNVNVSINQQTQQVTAKIDSLQQTVTNKLDTVNQSIGDLTDTTQKGFTDIKKGITDLPGKIGEMLQGLIVPDSDKVSDKFTDFKDLAENKLGVVYQVPEMMFDMANSIVSGAAEQKGEMTLPAFAIIMPDGQNLTVWDEYTFSIWPDGTEVIHTAVQTATSMICVIFTFNALKRKYEDWLDGK